MYFISDFHRNRFEKRSRNTHSFSYYFINNGIVYSIIYTYNHISYFVKLHYSIYYVLIAQNFFFLVYAVKGIKKKILQLNAYHTNFKIKNSTPIYFSSSFKILQNGQMTWNVPLCSKTFLHPGQPYILNQQQLRPAGKFYPANHPPQIRLLYLFLCYQVVFLCIRSHPFRAIL